MAVNRVRNKAVVARLRASMVDFDAQPVQSVLQDICAPQALFRVCHPIGDCVGAESYYQQLYKALFAAWPDLERRDTIVIAGSDADGAEWVGCCGHYLGSFMGPWLGIPATGHCASLRFHEFYRVAEGRIVEAQIVWDIPALMMQAGVWPMAPSLGREWLVPGPMTQDGLADCADEDSEGQRSCQIVVEMLQQMIRHPAEGGPEVMQLERYWHPRMSWYGPSGIGTARGISGFRRWHQIPFLNAMPDRGQYPEAIQHHFFGERQYVAVTGWPNMAQTLTGDGWMGIAPSGQRVTLRSLDFWRLQDGLIRENWVLVDLLDLYQQIGVDVFARMRERAGIHCDQQ